MLTWCLLVGAAFLAGGLNAIAGGGTFLTFPALVFTGTTPLAANATSTVALWPGSVASAWGYRSVMNEERGSLVPLILVSLGGGLAGALLALVLYPIVWVLLLPFRLVGIAVDGVFGVLRAIVTLPARLLGGSGRTAPARCG